MECVFRQQLQRHGFITELRYELQNDKFDYKNVKLKTLELKLNELEVKKAAFESTHEKILGCERVELPSYRYYKTEALSQFLDDYIHARSMLVALISDKKQAKGQK